MSVTLRTYQPASDFVRVRQFIIDTYRLYGGPHNWLLERWDFCRYVVCPIHGYYSTRYFGVPTRPIHHFRDEVAIWEATIGIWENDAGEIVGVANTENEEAGEAWFQTHPDYDLAVEMVDYAETKLADRIGDIAFVKAYAAERSNIERELQARSYRPYGRPSQHKVYLPDDAPAVELPAGYVIRSVAEEDDPLKRSISKAIAFGGGYAPSDWVPVELFAQVQQAPDYRPELDLFIVAPNGDYAAFCTIWVDEANGYANYEPVGTHREHQRMGLGTALLNHGFHLMADLGVKRSYMQSENSFYTKVGFRPVPGRSFGAWIKYV
jgi:GNAT superfamily N-acetyltransferase